MSDGRATAQADDVPQEVVMLEIGALAASLVGSFLVPLLKDGAGKLAEKLSEKMAAASADGLVHSAQQIWQRVRGKAADTADEELVELFERRPEAMSASIEQIVRQMLEQDESLRRTAADLIETQDRSVARWQVNAENVGIVHADGATIQGNAIVAGYLHRAEPEPHRAEPEATGGPA